MAPRRQKPKVSRSVWDQLLEVKAQQAALIDIETGEVVKDLSETSEALFLEYQWMASAIANKLLRLGSRDGLEDLMQKAYIGMLKAVRRFKRLKENRSSFKTYLEIWFKGIMEQDRIPEDLLSLDDCPGDEDGSCGLTYQELIASEATTALEQLESKEIVAIVKSLSLQMRVVIAHRFALGMTLEETGAKMNLTKERIRQIEGEALRLLKKKLLFLGRGAF